MTIKRFLFACCPMLILQTTHTSTSSRTTPWGKPTPPGGQIMAWGKEALKKDQKKGTLLPPDIEPISEPDAGISAEVAELQERIDTMQNEHATAMAQCKSRIDALEIERNMLQGKLSFNASDEEIEQSLLGQYKKKEKQWEKEAQAFRTQISALKKQGDQALGEKEELAAEIQKLQKKLEIAQGRSSKKSGDTQQAIQAEAEYMNEVVTLRAAKAAALRNLADADKELELAKKETADLREKLKDFDNAAGAIAARDAEIRQLKIEKDDIEAAAKATLAEAADMVNTLEAENQQLRSDIERLKNQSST